MQKSYLNKIDDNILKRNANNKKLRKDVHCRPIKVPQHSLALLIDTVLHVATVGFKNSDLWQHWSSSK